MYDPRISRFLSVDPLLQDPSNSQNFNRYNYVMNNPLKYTDPSGYGYDDDYDSSQSDYDATIRTIEIVIEVGMIEIDMVK